MHFVRDTFPQAARHAALSAAAPPRVLLLGIGNPACGDDAAGVLAVRLAAARPLPGVAVAELHGDLLRLPLLCTGLATLICADAATGAAPGAIQRFDLATDILPREPAPCSSHGMGLAEAIALMQALGDAPPRILVYTIAGENFAPGAPLTPKVAAALPPLSRRLRHAART